MTGYAPEASPVVFWDLYGKAGHPVRATISEIGPSLLGRILELNDTQAGMLEIAFKLADDRGLLLLDLDDLRALLAFVADNRKEISTSYGLVSAPSLAAIQRALLTLEREGGEALFGEPALDLADLMRTDLERPRHRQHPRRRPADPQAAAVLELPAVAAVRALREPAGGRRSRQAEAGLLLRRGAPALRRRAAGAAPAGRAGRPAHPLQGRGRLLLLAVPRRRARRDPRPARQSHPARAARLHAARPEGGAHRGRDVRRQPQARRRAGDLAARRSARRWCRCCRTRACRCRSSAR